MQFIPAEDYRYAFRKDDKGTDVGILQLNLSGVAVDGIFGRETEAAVLDWQREHGLVVDGIAGLATQQSILVQLSRPATKNHGLPGGLLKSVAFNESSFQFSSAGRHQGDDGWDVGAFARSTGSGPASEDWYRSAFDVAESAEWTANNVAERKSKFSTPVDSRYLVELATNDRVKFLWQLAILSHNWPGNPDTGYGGAQGICNHGRATTDDDAPAQWIIDATRGRLSTPRQWVMSYVAKATVFIKWK